MTKEDTRPVFINLLRINLPITGIVSILHRISGFILFFSFPFLVWLLNVMSAEGFSFALYSYGVSVGLVSSFYSFKIPGQIIVANIVNYHNTRWKYYHNPLL